METNCKKRLWQIMFILYAAVMLWLLFGRAKYSSGLSYWEQVQADINLRPLYTVKNYLYVLIHRTNPHLYTHVIVNLAGNILMFIPLGFFLPVLFANQRRFWIFLLTFCGLIAAVELLQLFTLRGSCDIDDLILNTVGGLIGYPFGRLTYRMVSKKS